MPRRSDAARIATEQARALKLKLDGCTVREIADDLRVSVGTAQNRITDAMAELVLPVADEVRQMELARLDRWQRKLEQRLDDGEDPVRVVPVALQVQTRRSKYLGLDAPERTEITAHQIGAEDIEMIEMVNEAKARNAAVLAAIQDGDD